MTTIVGFEGSLVARAAGVLPVIARTGEEFELIRCKPEVERVHLDQSEFERLTERGLIHQLQHQIETESESPVLLFLPDRLLFARRFPPWDLWFEEYLHGPGIKRAFHEHGVSGFVLSMTKAHDLLRLLLEEVLGFLRLDLHRWRRPEDTDARLFLRSASATLKDPKLRERVFGLLFAQSADDEVRWNALVRDAQREFGDEALERIKADAAALRPPPPLSATAG